MALPDTYYDYIDTKDGKQSYWPLFWDIAGLGGLHLAGKALNTSSKVDDILSVTGQVGSVASDVDQLYDVTDKIIKTVGNTSHIYSPYTGISNLTETNPRIDYVQKYEDPSVVYSVNPVRDKAIENSPYHTFLPTVVVTAKRKHNTVNPIWWNTVNSNQDNTVNFNKQYSPNYDAINSVLLPLAGQLVGGPFGFVAGQIGAQVLNH